MSAEVPITPLRRRVRLLSDEISLAIQWDSACILLALYRSEITKLKVESSLRRYFKRAGQSIQEVKITKKEYDVPVILRDHPSRRETVFFVSGLQWAGGRGYSNAYRALNMHREYLVEAKIRCLFWLSLSEIQQLPRHAPDFWAFRHKVVDFPELPSRQDIVLSGVQGEDLIGAIEKHQKALKQGLDDHSIHQKLAVLFHAVGCYEDAIFHYKKSIRLAPGNKEDFLGLSQTYRDLGQEELARRIQNKANKLFMEPGV